ncbi:MAG: S8 family serine peptidase [Nitrososphaerota archaeon]
MSRTTSRVERILEASTRAQIVPVIVETVKSPRELFIQVVSQINIPVIRRLSLFAGELETVLSMFGARLIERFKMFSIPATRNILEDLAQSREVVKIYPNRIVKALQLPTVPQEGVYKYVRKGREVYYTSTYYTSLYAMGAMDAHQAGINGSKYTRPLAVIDTTAIPYHESISRATPSTTIPGIYTDGNGHGVWVAAAAGGGEWTAVNGLKTIGVAPGARLMTVKSLGFIVGTGSDSWIIEGIARALAANAKVINMSLGTEDVPSDPGEDPQVRIIEQLSRQGYIFCIAAGNSGPESYTINSPGIAESAVTVGSYNPVTGRISTFSSRGPTPDGRVKPDCVAPGENIFGPTVGMLDYALEPRQYLRGSILSGTSMATPHVSGLVYLMAEHAWSLGIDLTADMVKDVLKTYPDFPEKSNEYGWGALTWGKWISYLRETGRI